MTIYSITDFFEHFFEFLSARTFEHLGRIRAEVAAGLLPALAHEFFAADDALALFAAHAVHDDFHGTECENACRRIFLCRLHRSSC